MRKGWFGNIIVWLIKPNIARWGVFATSILFTLIVVSYLQVSSFKTLFRKEITLWMNDLTNAVALGDGGFIDKVSRGIFAPQLKWIEIQDRNGIHYAYPCCVSRPMTGSVSLPLSQLAMG